MAGDQWEFKVSRHDTDDHVGLAIEENLRAENVGIAMKAALPGGIAEDDYLLLLVVFLLGEDAAEEWLNFECGQNSAAHAGCIDDGRIAHAGELIRGSLVAAQAGEAMGVARVVSNVGNSYASFSIAADVGALKDVCYHHESIGVGKWQRTQ